MSEGVDTSHERTPGHVSPRQIPAGRLQEIFEAHQQWVRSRGREGSRADLADADLGRANLRSAVLSEAHLEGISLERATLASARLQEANLQQANLRGADLQQANLRRANLHGADLFEANLTEAALSETNLQAANLYLANLSGADLQRATLQRAFLKEALLQEADLQGANLQGANLQGADLRRADLRRAILQDANLAAADLRGADVQGADLRGSNLHETAFQQAHVRDVDLTASTGLIGRNLAGADVAAARLPEDIRAFGALANVRAWSRQARHIFLLMLCACAYAWLTIAATTDAMLLTNASTALFPQLRVPIPSVAFYTLMPLFLVGLYIAFHLHLQRLWETLAELPAVFPDGRPLDMIVYPWLLHGLVRAHVSRLRRYRPPLSRLQTGLCTLLAWWAVPFILLLFWVRYLPGHDWGLITLHITLLVAAVGFGILFQGLARTILRGRRVRRYTHGAVALVVAFVIDLSLSFLTFGALTGVPPHLYTAPEALRAPAPNLAATDMRRLVPYLFVHLGHSPFANLEEVEVSSRASSLLATPAGALPLVNGARLKGRSLRYARAARAFLVQADLRDADLFAADLRQADLRGANFAGADMSGTDLRGADLQHATGLTQAHLAAAYTDASTRLPAYLVRQVQPAPQNQ